MEPCAIDSLVKFCIDQRTEFDAEEWYGRFDRDGKALALAATYLSMTSWYGHEHDLEQIAASMHAFNETSYGLYRESQAIGFDLPHFSARVRIGIALEKRGQAGAA